MYYTQSLHRALQQFPERTATRCGSRSHSFRQLAERVARLAGGLRTLGMEPGDRVGILALNSDRYFECQLAVPWAGGVINPCNVRWSAAEIAYSLRDCSTQILFVDAAFEAMVGAIRQSAPRIREVVSMSDTTTEPLRDYESLLSKTAPIADTIRKDDDLYGIFYTGGTTGVPKGVMLTHRNIGASALALLGEGVARRNGTYLHAAPMFHMADFGLAAPQQLLGNTHAFIPGFQPRAFCESVARDRVTDTMIVPTMVQMLADHIEQAPRYDLSSLRWIGYGASAITEAVLDRAMALLPGCEFAQGYGMTELAPIATMNPTWCHSAEGRRAGKIRSAGRAVSCTEIRIVAPDGAEVPRGRVGEVAVRGPNVMAGYWNAPEQTSAALRGGWMHTGDAGYMDEDGFIFIVDRIKDMIKTGGENVFSAEVENALGKHPAVASCAVIAVPHATWGEAVHALVVMRPGTSASAEQLIAHCREQIAAFKCPRSIEFLDTLPLSGAGKVLKASLREKYWQGHDRRVA